MGQDPHEAAFAEALRRYGALVARIAATHEANPALADELTQEIHLALWRALPNRRGEANLRSFVARVAHNVAVSHVRAATRRPTRPLDDDLAATLVDGGEGPEAAADLALRRAQLMRALHALPLAQRQVLTLHLEGLTDRETAEALGLSEGNVAVRLTRARAQLRKLMEAERCTTPTKS